MQISDKELQEIKERLSFLYEYRFESPEGLSGAMKPITDKLISTIEGLKGEVEHWKNSAESWQKIASDTSKQRMDAEQDALVLRAEVERYRTALDNVKTLLSRGYYMGAEDEIDEALQGSE